MKAKYPNGLRVKVKVGHTIWTNDSRVFKSIDIRPELTEDTATIEYTYGEKSETDPRFSKGDDGYKEYSLKFDKYGSISWFDEDDIIPIGILYYEDKPYRILHEGKVKTTSIFKKVDDILKKEGDEEIDYIELNKELSEAGVKWIDVVIYEPLYEECDIRICVKEKEDFYNNYKPKTDENTSTSNSAQ